jgi:hypothetical protein
MSFLVNGRGRATARTRAVAITGAALLLAAGLAACTSSSDGGGSGSGATGDTSPGVTDTTVKMGFIISDRGTLGQTLGFKIINPGTVETRTAGIQAVVDYVNQNGGVGGRQIEPVIKTYASLDDSAANAEALCKEFTQDEQVFALWLDGQLQNNARPCYKQGRAIMIDSSAIAQDQTAYENYGGYLWSASNTEYSSFSRTQIRTLAQAGYFNGANGIMLLISDDEVSRRVAETVTKPELQAAGVTNIKEAFIDGSNQGTLGATVAAAQTTGASEGLNRALAVGGARILPLALAGFEANDFQAVWGMSTWDNPFNIESNRDSYVAARYPGMTGLGFSQVIDTSDPSLPFPDPAAPGQARCKGIVDASPTSQPPQDVRANYADAFKFCDAVFFLKAVLDKAPKDLTTEAFKQAAFSITNEYQPASGFSAQGGQNVYAPINTARPMKWDTDRNIFVYTNTAIPLATQ